MPTFHISAADLLRSKVVTPGWYRCKVVNVGENPARTDGSLNVEIELEIQADGPFKGVPLARVFNEKAPGFSAGYFRAFKVAIPPEGGDFNFDATKGKLVDAYVKNDQYQGRTVNRVEDFRPAA